MKNKIRAFMVAGLLPLVGHTQDIEQMIRSKPFKISGNASVRTIYTDYSGGNWQGGKPFDLVLTGSPVFQVYGLEIPVSFIWSPNNQSFQQPFNQYGTSPKYKWVTLHLGYRNLSYQPFTLAGHTMLGAGFDLTPGKWRIGMMYGRLSAATVIDTLTRSLQQVSFFRKGLAAHAGYGNEKSFIELSVLSAQDDTGSLKTDLSRLGQIYGTEIMPAGNAVAGVSGRIQIGKKMFVEADGALSIYTRDLRNPTVINVTEDEALKNAVRSIVYINATSSVQSAAQAAIGYSARNWTLRLRYKRIDPDFQSMGAYFINNDLQDITLAPTLNLLRGKLQLSGSLGFQNDNLRNTKTTLSRRVIGNLGVVAVLNKNWIINGNFSNYNNSSQPNTNITRISDTLRITQATQTFSLTPIYTFVKNDKAQNITLSLNANTLQDYNNSYQPGMQSRNINTYVGILNYHIAHTKKGWGAQAGLTYNELSGLGLQERNQGLTLAADRRLLKDKLSLSAQSSFLWGRRDAGTTRTLNLALQVSYKLGAQQSINLGSYYNQTNIDAVVGTQQLTNVRAELAYAIQFGKTTQK